MILPLSLKIIAGVLIILLLLLIFMKSRRKPLLFLLIITIGIGVWFGLKEYNRTNKDPENEPAKYEVAATDLLKEFQTGDSSALNKKYDDQIISITGMVKEFKKDTTNFTIMLGDTANLSSIQCEMNLSHEKDATGLANHSSVTIKGHFVGYRKGEEMMGISLGSTINMNRCILVKK